jgi:hypothetical protein
LAPTHRACGQRQVLNYLFWIFELARVTLPSAASHLASLGKPSGGDGANSRGSFATRLRPKLDALIVPGLCVLLYALRRVVLAN